MRKVHAIVLIVGLLFSLAASAEDKQTREVMNDSPRTKVPGYLESNIPGIDLRPSRTCLEAPPLRSGQAFIPRLESHGVFGQGL